MIILLMGVAGSGKTTVGEKLAARLGVHFFDADHFHPRANILKIATGRPLTDADRLPWLHTLRGMIEGWIGVGASAVLACSALKQAYRDILIHPGEPIQLVFLHASPDTIRQRMLDRNHFFKPQLLQSQLDTLEPPSPDAALFIDAEDDLEAIVDRIASNLP